VAPRTPTEALLVSLWSELLGVKDIGIHDDFFELRGHSLLAMRLVARINERLGMRLAIPQVFLHPRLSALAASIDDLRWAGKGMRDEDFQNRDGSESGRDTGEL
jgi:hypothetical protein